MKKLNLTLLFIALLSNLYGQREENDLVLSFGPGYSPFGGGFLKTFYDVRGGFWDGPIGTINVNSGHQLVYNGIADYALKNNFSIGAGWSYQVFSGETVEYDYDTWESFSHPFKLVRSNYGFRGLWHFNNAERIDLYTGVRMGLTTWRNRSTAESEVISKLDDRNKFAVQVLFGGNFYFNSTFGITMETALGTAPYLMFIGICAKL